MHEIRSAYIVEPIDTGWIIERLMRDVATELNARGITSRIGPPGAYKNENVIFNSRYLAPFFDGRALVNSVFITHVDDKIKEMELKSCFKDFNSLVCMSSHDADFVAALKTNRAGVVGIDLPARDLRVRPTRIALFSACYEDGRKNEHWIAEYFRDKPKATKQSFIFCFMGWGWEKFCVTLGDLEMNYEIYRYSRFTPGEYELYKEVLAGMDTLIYLGFDGGAMSVYEALNAGIDAIVPNNSYHRGLGDTVSLFDDQAGFFAALDGMVAKATAAKDVLIRRSVASYTTQLVAHWQHVIQANVSENGHLTNAIQEGGEETQTLSVFRSHYKRLSLTRIRSALIRIIPAISRAATTSYEKKNSNNS